MLQAESKRGSRRTDARVGGLSQRVSLRRITYEHGAQAVAGLIHGEEVSAKKSESLESVRQTLP